MLTDPGNAGLATQLDRIENTLSKMDEKLDNHLERIAVAESHIAWLRGHARMSITIFLAVVGVITAAVFNTMWPK